MKTKNVVVGFLVIGFLVVLMSTIIVNRPDDSMQQSNMCQLDTYQCRMPDTLSSFPLFPR